MAKITYANEIYAINSEEELLQWADARSIKKVENKPRGNIREMTITLKEAVVSVYYLNKGGIFHVDYVRGLKEK
jgi:hypothetical protein